MAWTKEQDELLKQLVSTTRRKDLSRILEKSEACVYGRIKKFGLEQFRVKDLRHNTINDQSFSYINNISCYYGGVLASDGNIDSKVSHLSLSQCEKNKQVVFGFKEFLSCSYIVREDMVGPYKQYDLWISSKQIISDLNKHFNITPNKSLTLKPPNLIEKEHVLSYICGIIDGDGCIHTHFYPHMNKNYLLLSMAGTSELLNWIADQIELLVPYKYATSKRNKKLYKIKNRNCYVININGYRVLDLYEEVKKLDIPLLKCKWNQIEDYLAKYPISSDPQFTETIQQ